MISHTELMKLIREHTGCGMWDAKRALEKIANDIGVLTRRDQMAIEILNGIIAGRLQGTPMTEQYMDEATTNARKMAQMLMDKLS